MVREDFDSDTEFDFYFWCLEAKAVGMIDGWEYHSMKFPLSPKVSVQVEKRLKTKTKLVDKHLLAEHGYEPDFILKHPSSRLTEMVPEFGRAKPDEYPDIYIDIKPPYSKFSDTKQVFSINQKWVMQRHGVYVHKVVLDPVKKKSIRTKTKTFFERTWVPDALAWCKGRLEPTRKKRYSECLLLSQIGL